MDNAVHGQKNEYWEHGREGSAKTCPQQSFDMQLVLGYTAHRHDFSLDGRPWVTKSSHPQTGITISLFPNTFSRPADQKQHNGLFGNKICSQTSTRILVRTKSCQKLTKSTWKVHPSYFLFYGCKTCTASLRPLAASRGALQQNHILPFFVCDWY